MTALVSGVSHALLMDCDEGIVRFEWAGPVPNCQKCSTPLSKDGEEDTKAVPTLAVWASEWNVECPSCGWEVPIQ